MLILLLMSYSQLLAHVYAGYHYESSNFSEKSTYRDETLAVKATTIEGTYICIEEEENEEDDHTFLKTLKDRPFLTLIYNQAEIPSLVKNYSSFFKDFSFSSLFRSQYLVLCVFRI